MAFKNSLFSPEEISHSDNHFSTSVWESWRASSSSFAVARWRRVLYTDDLSGDRWGRALNKFAKLRLDQALTPFKRKKGFSHAVFDVCIFGR
jgi:hypothetical protein